VEIKKNEDSNVQTNFIKIAADQPKLVYLEWIKIWVSGRSGKGWG